MQSNETNLEHRVESSRLGRLGAGLKHAMYAARQYIAISAAAIVLSVGAAGCDSGGDDDGTYSDSQGCSHLVGGKNGYMEDGCSGNTYCECRDVSNKSETSTHTVCSCVSDNSSSEPGYDKGY